VQRQDFSCLAGRTAVLFHDAQQTTQDRRPHRWRTFSTLRHRQQSAEILEWDELDEGLSLGLALRRRLAGAEGCRGVEAEELAVMGEECGQRLIGKITLLGQSRYGFLPLWGWFCRFSPKVRVRLLDFLRAIMPNWRLLAFRIGGKGIAETKARRQWKHSPSAVRCCPVLPVVFDVRRFPRVVFNSRANSRPQLQGRCEMRRRKQVVFDLAVAIAVLSLVLAEQRWAEAASIIVSGDTNIVNGLDGQFIIPIDPGNQRFFNNILAGGHRVIVQGPLGTGQTGWTSVDSSALEVNNFYNSEGINSSILSGTVTGSALAGADLFVKILPTAPSSPGEITVLRQFLSGGGTVFFVGENGHYPDFTEEDTAINADLTALGSGLRINSDYYLEGEWTQITGSRIASDRFAAGVTSFSYGVTASVSGGTPLFFNLGDNKPFVAYESVPEPLSIVLLIVGAVGVLVWWRRRA
jgi:hypothetical protein